MTPTTKGFTMSATKAASLLRQGDRIQIGRNTHTVTADPIFSFNRSAVILLISDGDSLDDAYEVPFPAHTQVPVVK